MLYSIENDFVKVSFLTKGAELCSMILKEDGTEYIWQADPKVWAHHAPVLFPTIGRMKDGEYIFEGETYHITSHGFGRDSEFEVLSKGEDSITFVLKPNELSAKMYPFEFELQICYSLNERTLKKTHTFINKENKVLYYELGGHDAYKIPLQDDEVMEDYYVDFGELDAIHPLCLDENILLLKDTYTIPLTEGKLPLNMELFKVDALIMHNSPVHSISLKSTKSKRAIKFDFDDFKSIGIWTKYMDSDTNFICLEPWSSLPDCAYLGKELEEKVDIRKVEAGEKDILSFSTTIK